jgi:hypothetical protein
MSESLKRELTRVNNANGANCANAARVAHTLGLPRRHDAQRK